MFRKVVNVTSLAGVMGNAGQVAYAAGKGGVVGLTKALAKEWGGLKTTSTRSRSARSTRVSRLRSGPRARSMSAAGRRSRSESPSRPGAGMGMMIPLGRPATAEEAARGVYFLCSPASDYVHGQVLALSGGLAVGMTS